jgi:hypothetical protein
MVTPAAVTALTTAELRAARSWLSQTGACVDAAMVAELPASAVYRALAQRYDGGWPQFQRDCARSQPSTDDGPGPRATRRRDPINPHVHEGTHAMTTITASQLDLATGEPQHLQALRRANEVRLARAELKHKVGDGAITAEEVVLTCPWEAASMTIAELLSSQRRWGTTRASTFLAVVGMPETKTIGSLTERQRSLLAGLL